VILIDVNLLLYSHDSVSPHHAVARAWLETTFSDSEQVGLAWLTVVAFLRISTARRALGHPLSVAEATAIVSEWFDRPFVSLVHPGERHWEILQRLLQEGQAAGPLVTDAHLAALAIEHRATLATTDRDFARFPGLRVLNPLASRP
jgi:uncharacterized protein